MGGSSTCLCSPLSWVSLSFTTSAPPPPPPHVVLFLGCCGEAHVESWSGGWHGASREGVSWLGWLLYARRWLRVNEAKRLPAQRWFLVTWTE